MTTTDEMIVIENLQAMAATIKSQTESLRLLKECVEELNAITTNMASRLLRLERSRV